MNKVKVVDGQLDLLQDLGFEFASKKINKLKSMKHKMMVAYEHFRYVTQEKIDQFNLKLKAESWIETRQGSRVESRYKKLVFIPVEKYDQVPPMPVLLQMQEAKQKGCFDYFEVAKIEAIVEIRDPIIFGRIIDCPDRFFVAQWDDDVKIDDIINQNEG